MSLKHLVIMCFVGTTALMASPISNDQILSLDGFDTNQEVLNAYMELKDALVATDPEAAQKAAKTLNKIALKAKHTAIAEHAEKIAAATTIKEQRELFEPISEAILELCQAQGTETTVYHQYCPMALGNKGASWLSYSKEIRNPYFGKMMLKCGMVKAEIK